MLDIDGFKGELVEGTKSTRSTPSPGYPMTATGSWVGFWIEDRGVVAGFDSGNKSSGNYDFQAR